MIDLIKFLREFGTKQNVLKEKGAKIDRGWS
jgi:hypothetical protein